MFTGQLLLIKTLLNLKNLSMDVCLDILKILGDLIKQNVVEEGVLFTLDTLINNLVSNYYVEINIKKLSEKFLKFIDTLIVSKSNPKNIIEFSIIFSITKHSLKESLLSYSLKNYLPNSILENLLEEKNLYAYLKLLLTNKPRENDFHISFSFLLELLKQADDFKKAINVWNVLIDPEMMTEMKTTSLKNYQFMVYLVSKFLLENYFNLTYIKQIFDHSFFESFLKFANKNKFKYISNLVDIIQQKLKDQDDKEMVSEYSYDLLNVFGNDPATGISPQTYKGFFLFLFENLQDSHKNDFIDSITSESGDDADDIEAVQYKTTIMRTLLTSREIDDKTKSRISDYLLSKFYNTQNEGIEIESLLAERTLASLLLMTNDQKDSKIIKNIISVHKTIQQLAKSQTINIEKEDYKVILY
jgi:hypothetical protein